MRLEVRFAMLRSEVCTLGARVAMLGERGTAHSGRIKVWVISSSACTLKLRRFLVTFNGS